MILPVTPDDNILGGLLCRKKRGSWIEGFSAYMAKKAMQMSSVVRHRRKNGRYVYSRGHLE